MATVTGLTADRMLAIEAASVVDGDVVGDNLVLTKHDGSQINAGNVRGPSGPTGPAGQDLSVLVSAPVLDVGIANQIRAGRQLTPGDFTNLGLSVPLGLWNMSSLADASGNGRPFLNKSAVPFDVPGMNGQAAGAARLSGTLTQFLYISDAGAADPFRIKTGTYGCWIRSAKRGIRQVFISRASAAGTSAETWFWAEIDAANHLLALNPLSPAGGGASGSVDLADDRWHFVVVTMDGSILRAYVDGQLDGASNMSLSGVTPAANCPLDISGYAGDSGANLTNFPFFGRIDDVFITGDVLTDEQVRNLYCVKIPHTLGIIPTRVSLNVRRRRKGSSLVPSDFLTPPLRLHNFTSGSLLDEGQNNVPLANNVSSMVVAGADGVPGNGFSFNGASQSLSSTDTGLPGGITPSSFGCWFKTNANGILVAWGGAINSADIRIGVFNGAIYCNNGLDSLNGPFASDGQWHHIVAVQYNAVGSPTDDGVKRKLYLDGRLVGISTAFNPVTLTGANRFRIGCAQDATNFFTGQIDGVFVCGYALTTEQIFALYNKSAQELAPSPRISSEYVEGMSATDLFMIFDNLDSQSRVDVGVAA